MKTYNEYIKENVNFKTFGDLIYFLEKLMDLKEKVTSIVSNILTNKLDDTISIDFGDKYCSKVLLFYKTNQIQLRININDKFYVVDEYDFINDEIINKLFDYAIDICKNPDNYKYIRNALEHGLI